MWRIESQPASFLIPNQNIFGSNIFSIKKRQRLHKAEVCNLFRKWANFRHKNFAGQLKLVSHFDETQSPAKAANRAKVR